MSESRDQVTPLAGTGAQGYLADRGNRPASLDVELAVHPSFVPKNRERSSGAAVALLAVGAAMLLAASCSSSNTSPEVRIDREMPPLICPAPEDIQAWDATWLPDTATFDTGDAEVETGTESSGIFTRLSDDRARYENDSGWSIEYERYPDDWGFVAC